MTVKPKFMLDTNICIYIQRRHSEKINELYNSIKPGEAVISVVTWGELLFGAVKSRKAKAVYKSLEEFVTIVQILPMPLECAKYYGNLRADLEKRGRPIGMNDLWLAAHAMTLNLTLITNNTREFKRIPNLKIDNWI